MNNVKLLGMAVLVVGLVTGGAVAESNAPTGVADKPARHERRGGSQTGAVDQVGRPGKDLGHGLARELGLSEEKAAEVKGLMQTARQNMLKLKADRDLAKADLDKLLAADTLDEKAISAAADKLAQANADMTKAMVKTRLAVSSALTPEQRARMHELRQGTMKRFKERGQGGRAQKHAQENLGGDNPGGEP